MVCSLPPSMGISIAELLEHPIQGGCKKPPACRASKTPSPCFSLLLKFLCRNSSCLGNNPFTPEQEAGCKWEATRSCLGARWDQLLGMRSAEPGRALLERSPDS